MVAASRAGAREVVGIDSDPKAMELAPLLLADHGVTAGLHIADLTQPGLANQLGEFDLVLCNDVLEHVQNIDRAVDHLGQLLAPGGRLFLEIPNGNAITYVRSDGHYKLPGITLLDFDDARRWHNAFFPDMRYDTYYYASLDFYVAAFSRVGILLRMVNVPNFDPLGVTRLAAELKELQFEFAGLPTRLPDKPHDLIRLIQERASQYAQELAARLGKYQDMSDPQEKAVLGTSLLSTYQVGNWVFEGYKLSRDQLG